MSQTSYNNEQGVAFAGMRADIFPARIRTGVNGEAVALPFGVALKKGAADGKFALPTAAGDKIIGIALHEHGREPAGLIGDQGIAPGAVFPVLDEGTCYVKVETPVVAEAPVYARFAAGGNGLGSFRADADGAKALLVKGARFLTSAAANGYAVVDFHACLTSL